MLTFISFVRKSPGKYFNMKLTNLPMIISLHLGLVFAGSGRNRIIGGHFAKPGQFPSVVSIKGPYGRHSCGGVLIARHYVLTAAHCFDSRNPNRWIIQAGTHDIETGGRFYEISNVLVHENWDHHTFSNDIALLRTKVPVLWNAYTQPILLPPQNFELALGEVLIAAGWGGWRDEVSYYPTSRYLQFVSVPVVDNQKCNENRDLWTGPKQLCAGSIKWHDPCKGDSGGPLMSEKYTYGIVSFGVPCATGIPTTFTKISAYVDWIFYVSQE